MDAPARRRALALAGTGLDVTILTRRSMEPGSSAVAQRSLIGGVHVQRLDTPGVLWTTRDRRRRRHRAWMPRLVYRDQAEAAAAQARLDILAMRAGNGRRAMSGLIVAARAQVRLRRLCGRVVDAARRRGWRGFDRLVARTTIGASWRRDLPEAYDDELALGPELDRLATDVIHARGLLALRVAARASARAPPAGPRSAMAVRRDGGSGCDTDTHWFERARDRRAPTTGGRVRRTRVAGHRRRPNRGKPFWERARTSDGRSRGPRRSGATGPDRRQDARGCVPGSPGP